MGLAASATYQTTFFITGVHFEGSLDALALHDVLVAPADLWALVAMAIEADHEVVVAQQAQERGW